MHGVPRRSRTLGALQGEQFVSYYVDSAPLDAGPHAAIMCTGCHLDFAYKSPHNIEQTDWVRTARLACKNCHQDQWTQYSNRSPLASRSSPARRSAPTMPRSRCAATVTVRHTRSDWLTDNPGQAKLHAPERLRDVRPLPRGDWDNYQDYYHGAAYQEGSPDAPRAGTATATISILPSSDRALHCARGQSPGDVRPVSSRRQRQVRELCRPRASQGRCTCRESDVRGDQRNARERSRASSDDQVLVHVSRHSRQRPGRKG